MSTATKEKPVAKKKTDLKLQPLGDRVVVRRESSEAKTAGGIVLPDSAKEKPSRGVVVSVGNGKLLENGGVRALEIKAGDTVLFGKYSGSEVKLNGEEHLILREEDVLCVIEK